MLTLKQTTVREIGPCHACTWRKIGDRPPQKDEIVFHIKFGGIEFVICEEHLMLLETFLFSKFISKAGNPTYNAEIQNRIAANGRSGS